MTADQMKRWIDNASYKALLSMWRFAQAGDPFFQGDVGDYYALVMAQKRAEVGEDAHAEASRAIGWNV